MQPQSDAVLNRVKEDPQFKELIERRSSLGWKLSVIMLVIYFGFILTIAYDKELLARSLSGGATTIGIPIGIGVIISAFVLTAIYVWRANREFDNLTRRIVENAKQ
ncbi:MAG TPA: DUF485 domain-containing protein [Hyphomicrobium sp.]|nr:DUF485 domain-containing protein [Hyphomicrobium sp.]